MTRYQKYQLQWMIDHDKSLTDLMNEMTYFQCEGNEGTVFEMFDAWEYESNGFGGELWACPNEWLQCEAQVEPSNQSDDKREGNKMKYRKKPVVVEAYQTDKEMCIETLEGTMHAEKGDYIITGVNGEQYPCKPDIFNKTYEPCE